MSYFPPPPLSVEEDFSFDIAEVDAYPYSDDRDIPHLIPLMGRGRSYRISPGKKTPFRVVCRVIPKDYYVCEDIYVPEDVEIGYSVVGEGKEYHFVPLDTSTLSAVFVEEESISTLDLLEESRKIPMRVEGSNTSSLIFNNTAVLKGALWCGFYGRCSGKCESITPPPSPTLFERSLPEGHSISNLVTWWCKTPEKTNPLPYYVFDDVKYVRRRPLKFFTNYLHFSSKTTPRLSLLMPEKYMKKELQMFCKVKTLLPEEIDGTSRASHELLSDIIPVGQGLGIRSVEYEHQQEHYTSDGFRRRESMVVRRWEMSLLS